MAKINLAPDIRLEKLRIKKLNFYITLGALIIFGVLVLFILILQGYRWSQSYSLDQTKKKIASTEDELKNYKDIEDMVVNIEQGTSAINNIDKTTPKWSRFMPVLEQVTPNDISFTELSQSGNQFKAKAEGRYVYSIARLMKSLANYEYKDNQDDQTGTKLFQNVSVDGYSITDNGLVDFDITFEMKDGVLW